MVVESDTVEAEEHVLRRILNDQGDIDLNLNLPINRKSFRPTEADTDGISLYRASLVTAESVAEDGPNVKGYYVVSIPVGELNAIGISVLDNPVQEDDALPGHCIIPEITTTSPQKGLQAKLAELVNSNIDEYLVYIPE